MKPELDIIVFSRAIKLKRIIDLDIGLREAATQIGVSHSALSRLENKHIPDVNTFIKVCYWLDVNPVNFYKYTN